ncbi:phosphotransferase [Paenibacillus dendritiformis]|uniref:phosphotransferase n=1 Tax=Paenibacillus dendritiformis TaxID=130049 RepID=UPI00143D2C8D|nr:phosphotransferase [Paenibacillus dendritiformis]NKI23346.1 phosphotransferase [Paenibacillus dendritiformis]NRF98404.1 phosphotransferase [Paenibacillus dendritiformis]
MQFPFEEALGRIGLSTKGLSASYLGEGAWHTAYLLSTREHEALVLRVPKPVVYGAPFGDNEQEMLGEYAARGLYYEHANRALPGVCPDFFASHAEPGLTFTIESYCGPTLSLQDTTRSDAVELGRQCGQFMAAMSRGEAPLRGFGFLGWQEEGLAGEIQGDLQIYWHEEANEYREQFKELLQAGIPLQEDIIRDKLEEALRYRLGRTPRLSLTNRDISPENIIVDNGRLRLIDPLPLQYDDHVFAGNLLNNFNTLFPSYDSSPRYAKHRFSSFRYQLNGFADGFLAGYAEGDENVEYSVKVEEFLMLLDLACHHAGLMDEEWSEGIRLRVGDRAAVKKRIPEYIRRLEQFEFEKGRSDNYGEKP